MSVKALLQMNHHVEEMLNDVTYDDIPTERPKFPPGCCEMCGNSEARKIPSRTCYANKTLTIWDRVAAEDGGLTDPEVMQPDPNPDLLLCAACAEDYETYWSEMWDEYNRDRI